MTPRRGAWTAAIVCLALAAAGCTADGDAPAPASPAPPASSQTSPPESLRGDVTGPGQFRPGLPATVDLPAGAPSAVVVLVPGGGWSSADPTGLAPLAASLVEAGLAVVTITYGTSGSQEFYPLPADDVACGVAFAAAQVPGVPVVLLGHSAGAHLAALVGLQPTREEDTGCPSPPHEADGVVGLAGPYDVSRTGGLAWNLFGADLEDAPDLWTEGNPLEQADRRTDVPFLLVHGDADRVVPVRFTTDLAQALSAAGHAVQVEVLAGVDHSTVYAPEVVTGLVTAWAAAAVAAAP